MNYIYCTNINSLKWSSLQFHKKVLEPTNQYDVDRFKFDQDKCRSLIGKLLLLYLIKKYDNYQGAKLPNFTYSKYKKPMIDSMTGGFNISHAGDWVICSYNNQGEIGVDIEKKVAINIEEYQEVLTKSEYRRFKNNDALDFFQLWTLKEAIMKADGRGFFLYPNSFELPHPFINNAQITVEDNLWFLHSTYVGNYSLSIASANPIQNNVQISTLSCDELLLNFD